MPGERLADRRWTQPASGFHHWQPGEMLGVGRGSQPGVHQTGVPPHAWNRLEWPLGSATLPSHPPKDCKTGEVRLDEATPFHKSLRFFGM